PIGSIESVFNRNQRRIGTEGGENISFVRTGQRSLHRLSDLLPLLELEDARQGPTPLDLLPDPVLPLPYVKVAVRPLHREPLGHDDDPGLVPHDPVPGADDLAPALDLAPDLPVA